MTKKKVLGYDCVNLCPDNYSYFSREDGEIECVLNCPSGYFTKNDEDKECVNECNTNEFIDYLNKNCTNCQGRFTLEIDTNPDCKKICYNSCPSYTYYIDGLTSCHYFPVGDEKKCLFKSGDFKVCYPKDSCKELDSNYKYEYNKTCYTEFNCGDRYFYNFSGIIRCLENLIGKYQKPYPITECSQINYNFLRGKECVRSCDIENEYIIYPEFNYMWGVT